MDWYHLGENIHKASDAVFREGRQARRAWTESRPAERWEGKHRLAREAVAALRKQVRSSAKREALRALEVHLKNNAERMDYAQYRAEGLPIGSGPVESACKSLVGARRTQAGMRSWRRRQAEAVLRLRAT